MFDDLMIRNKLILLVVGPLLVVVLLASMGARSRRDSADDSARVAQLVTVAQLDSDAVYTLQQEALYSAASIASGRDAWRKELARARSNTDKALAGALGRLRGDVAAPPPGTARPRAWPWTPLTSSPRSARPSTRVTAGTRRFAPIPRSRTRSWRSTPPSPTR